jgi:hypothetical protein
VVISPTASQGAIGGANVASFVPKPPPTGGPPTVGAAPVATAPKRITLKALAKGRLIKVKVAGAGKVKIAGTVPAKVLRRTGKPVVVAAGSAIAQQAGTVAVKLRLTATGRKKRKRLKGARMTLRASHGGLTATKRVTLR